MSHARNDLCPAALATLLLVCGCGYSQESLFPESRRFVAVDIFGNDTFYRELEFPLTAQVVHELQSRAGISVVDAEHADVVLKGRITRVEQKVLSEDERDRPREVGATTEVQVVLVDRATGRVIKTAIVSDRAEYVTARGETLLTAQEESFVDLARRIVYVLEGGF
ncbi:MAG: LptE family protein [Planctomycetota bacterium]